MILPLSKTSKITVCSTAVAAGSNNVTCTGVNMAGWTGVLFVAQFGTITANAVTALVAQDDSVSTFANAADLTGTSVAIADSGDNKAIYLDIYKPAKQYVRPIVNRSTANAIINSVIAIQYGPSYVPTTHDATTVSGGETHVGPAQGTA